MTSEVLNQSESHQGSTSMEIERSYNLDLSAVIFCQWYNLKWDSSFLYNDIELFNVAGARMVS